MHARVFQCVRQEKRSMKNYTPEDNFHATASPKIYTHTQYIYRS